MELQSENIKVVGDWDGELIWREKTPEEKCIDRLIKLGLKRDEATGAVKFYGSIIKK